MFLVFVRDCLCARLSPVPCILTHSSFPVSVCAYHHCHVHVSSLFNYLCLSVRAFLVWIFVCFHYLPRLSMGHGYILSISTLASALCTCHQASCRRCTDFKVQPLRITTVKSDGMDTQGVQTLPNFISDHAGLSCCLNLPEPSEQE